MFIRSWLRALCALSIAAVASGKLPSVGMGIGNLEHDKVKEMIELGVNEYGIKLIDTAMASQNQHIIGRLHLLVFSPCLSPTKHGSNSLSRLQTGSVHHHQSLVYIPRSCANDACGRAVVD